MNTVLRLFFHGISSVAFFDFFPEQLLNDFLPWERQDGSEMLLCQLLTEFQRQKGLFRKNKRQFCGPSPCPKQRFSSSNSTEGNSNKGATSSEVLFSRQRMSSRIHFDRWNWPGKGMGGGKPMLSRFYRKAIYLLCAAHKWLKKRKTNIFPFPSPWAISSLTHGNNAEGRKKKGREIGRRWSERSCRANQHHSPYSRT